MKSLLIVGCGDIAQRALPWLTQRYRVFALARTPAAVARLREFGVTPLPGDLDQRATLFRLAGLADVVLHLAPPPQQGVRDPRTANLLSALARRTPPQRLVYVSTSGVYGDCGGAVVSEARPLQPLSARARRRADAERQIRTWAQRNQVAASILRVPGIYAADRLPLVRLWQGTPAILAQEDSYTNFIHADDLARILIAALHHARPHRVYHASDDSELKAGDYLDLVADACGLPRVPRISRAAAQQVLSPALLSFLNESRRLDNRRMKRELRVVLRYPTVAVSLLALKPDARVRRRFPAADS